MRECETIAFVLKLRCVHLITMSNMKRSHMSLLEESTSSDYLHRNCIPHEKHSLRCNLSLRNVHEAKIDMVVW
jgi:hypothetical protein